MSFLPKSFGSDGFILGVNNTWYQAGFSTASFSSIVNNGYYLKGTNIIYSKASITPGTFTLTNDTISFSNPASITGTINFTFETLQKGVLWDTSIETGSGTIDFVVKSYKYDIQFTVDSNKRFVPNFKNFLWEFTTPRDPLPIGNATNATKATFPFIKDPLTASMNSSYCAKLGTYLQTTLTTFLVNAQTSQSLSWVYGGYTTAKTFNFTPSNTSPFLNNAFSIVATNSLTDSYGKSSN